MTDNAFGQVEISWNLSPTFGATLEKIYLNTNPMMESTHDLWMVAIGAGAVKTPTTGSVSYGNNTQNFHDWGFDVTLAPNSGSFIGSATLTLWTEGVGVLTPITTAFFNATTPGNASHPGTPNLYAAYRTNNFGTQGEFFAGSNGTAVPEPASLLLLGTGLIGLAAGARKLRRQK